MELNALQQQLEILYDVRGIHQVEDFLLTDRGLAATAARGSALPDTPEALLIRQDRDNLDVSLFLEAELVERLRADSPAQTLHDGNLDDFLTAVEGVSHFLYLIWNARVGRSITQLEMELQAEVDKFVTASLWILRQYGRHALAELHPALFRRFRLRGDMSAERRRRYDHANRLASRYCAALQPVGSGTSGHHPLAELRRFYRMPQYRKIHHIRSLGRR
jgi:hypothetical protein